jgi:hypothetical protein
LCAVSRNSTTPVLHAIDITALLQGFSFTIMVPAAPGFRELRIAIGIPCRTAGATVAGCRTFAQDFAICSASANEIDRRQCAPATTRGSQVSIPSTSVQIWISSAASAAPTIAAAQCGGNPVLGGADEAAHHGNLFLRNPAPEQGVGFDEKGCGLCVPSVG